MQPGARRNNHVNTSLCSSCPHSHPKIRCATPISGSTWRVKRPPGLLNAPPPLRKLHDSDISPDNGSYFPLYRQYKVPPCPDLNCRSDTDRCTGRFYDLVMFWLTTMNFANKSDLLCRRQSTKSPPYENTFAFNPRTGGTWQTVAAVFTSSKYLLRSQSRCDSRLSQMEFMRGKDLNRDPAWGQLIAVQ